MAVRFRVGLVVAQGVPYDALMMLCPRLAHLGPSRERTAAGVVLRPWDASAT